MTAVRHHVIDASMSCGIVVHSSQHCCRRDDGWLRGPVRANRPKALPRPGWPGCLDGGYNATRAQAPPTQPQNSNCPPPNIPLPSRQSKALQTLTATCHRSSDLPTNTHAHNGSLPLAIGRRCTSPLGSEGRVIAERPSPMEEMARPNQH